MSAWHPKDGLSWQGTATGSVNRIESFSETLYDYDEGFEPVVAVEHGTTDIGFSPNLTASSVAACRFWDRSTSEGRTTATLEWAARYVGKQYLDNTSRYVPHTECVLAQCIEYGLQRERLDLQLLGWRSGCRDYGKLCLSAGWQKWNVFGGGVLLKGHEVISRNPSRLWTEKQTGWAAS